MMDVGTEGGVYIVKDNIRKCYRIPDECNIIQAAFFAIIKATELLNGDVIGYNKRVVIYIDSHATLKAIGRYRTSLNLVDRYNQVVRNIMEYYESILCMVM